MPLLELEDAGDRRPDGCSARSGWIVGTYLHGLLHNHLVTAALLDNLSFRRSGLRWSARLSESQDADPFDRLADHVEAAVEVRRLLSLSGLEALA
jgi:adenosylcobyric acid synthase